MTGTVTSGGKHFTGLVAAARQHGLALALLTALTVVMCGNLIFSADFAGGWDVASINYPVAYFGRIGSYFSLWEDSGTGYVTPIGLFHLLAFVADVLSSPALVARAILVFAVLLAGLLMYLYIQRKRAMRTTDYKYIRSPSPGDAICRYCQRVLGGEEELYDLLADPAERANIVTTRPEIREHMCHLLSNWGTPVI